MRKSLKFLHTLSGCGLIGALTAYMVLLAYGPQDTAASYADLRQSIAAISNYILLPSLAIGLVSGLLSMTVHTPFLSMRWAWAKAIMGILMFKGVLTVIGAKADHAAAVSQKIANGEVPAAVLEKALAQEWYTLAVVMALSVANIVLGIWRPRLKSQSEMQARRKPTSAPTPHPPN